MTFRSRVAMTLGAAVLVACAGRRVAEAPSPPSPPLEVAPVPPATAPPAVAAPPTVASDFQASVRPLLARTCTPCHVPGGRMYERMPFDRPEVVLSHKDGILRRLKHPDDRQVLERWLAGQS